MIPSAVSLWFTLRSRFTLRHKYTLRLPVYSAMEPGSPSRVELPYASVSARSLFNYYLPSML